MSGRLGAGAGGGCCRQTQSPGSPVPAAVSWASGSSRRAQSLGRGCFLGVAANHLSEAFFFFFTTHFTVSRKGGCVSVAHLSHNKCSLHCGSVIPLLSQLSRAFAPPSLLLLPQPSSWGCSEEPGFPFPSPGQPAGTRGCREGGVNGHSGRPLFQLRVHDVAASQTYGGLCGHWPGGPSRWHLGSGQEHPQFPSGLPNICGPSWPRQVSLVTGWQKKATQPLVLPSCIGPPLPPTWC